MQYTEEEQSEKKEPEEMAKIKVDLAVFQEQFADLVVNGEYSIQEAESIQAQAKALKSLAKATTELEWKTKKDAYETSRTKTDELKNEYYEIRDIRKTLMNACADIFSGAKKKIEDYRAECVRKAEAEKQRIAKELREKEETERKAKEREEENNRKRIAAESKAAEEEARRVEVEKKKAEVTEPTPNKEGMKVISETGVTVSTSCFMHGDYEGEECQSCIKEAACPDPGQTNVSKTTEPDAPLPPQKAEEGQNEPVMEEIDILNANIWDAICGDIDGFLVKKITIVDKWRHGTVEEAVVESLETGKRYQSNFRDSCKEMDFEDMNGPGANFFEIKQEPGFNVEVFDMAQFIGAIIRGERGATFNLLQPNIPSIIEFANTLCCDRGEIIIPGCKVVF